MSNEPPACEEPWIGLFSINTDGTVVFCPCYAKTPIGKIDQSSVDAIWHGEKMRRIREQIAAGELPDCCSGQICPPVLGGRLRAAVDRD